MMMKHILCCLLLLSGFGSLFSQGVAIAAEDLEGTKFKARFHNTGEMFNSYVGFPRYEVPKTDILEDKKMASGQVSLWMAGFDSAGVIHSAGHYFRYGNDDYEFFPGPYRSTGEYECNSPEILFARNTNGSRITGLSNGDAIFCFTDSIGIYHSSTGTITMVALPGPRYNLVPVELPDGRIFLSGDNFAGGFPALPCLMLDSNYVLTSVSTLNFFHIGSSVTVLDDGRVLISGLLGTEIYNPATDQSAIIGSPGLSRSHNEALKLSDGRVLISGGNTGNFSDFPTTETMEIYDPSTGLWTQTASMAYLRADHNLLQLPNGKVLISGNRTIPGFAPVIGEFDPATNLRTDYKVLDRPLDMHRAYLDSEGEIYFIGHGGGDIYTERDRITKLNYATGELSELQFVTPGQESGQLANGRIIMHQNEDSNGDFVILDPIADRIQGHRWQYLWKVSRAEIQQFQTDFNNGAVDFDQYPDILTWPAHGDVARGEDAHLAPFVDVNMDGRYKPAEDGDYPCIKGDFALWTVYNDDAGPHTNTGGEKLGVQVKVMAYAYDCAVSSCPDTLVDYATFVHFEVDNRSQTDLFDMRAGVFSVSNLGYYLNDFTGSDSLLELGYFYNEVDNDTHATAYAGAHPAFGSMWLQHPGQESSFLKFYDDLGANGNPYSPADFFNYLSGRWLDSTGIVKYSPSGYEPFTGPPYTNYIYTGDDFCPGGTNSWSEINVGAQAHNPYTVQGFGPFDLPAAGSVEFDQVFLFARGTDHLNSVCRLKDLGSAVRNWWPNTDNSCFNIAISNDSPNEAALGSSSLSVYPNPAGDGVTVAIWEEKPVVGQLKIVNAMGQQLMRRDVSGNEWKLNVSHLTNGLHFVILESRDGRFVQKLVVRH